MANSWAFIWEVCDVGFAKTTSHLAMIVSMMVLGKSNYVGNILKELRVSVGLTLGIAVSTTA